MDKSPFVTSVDKRSQSDVAQSCLSLANSDQLTLYNAFVGWVLLLVVTLSMCADKSLKMRDVFYLSHKQFLQHAAMLSTVLGSYSLTVCLSVCHTAGVVSNQMNTEWCGLHCQVARWLWFLVIWGSLTYSQGIMPSAVSYTHLTLPTILRV